MFSSSLEISSEVLESLKPKLYRIPLADLSEIRGNQSNFSLAAFAYVLSLAIDTVTFMLSDV